MILSKTIGVRRRVFKGVEDGLQAACLTGGSPLKRPQGHSRGCPPAGLRRVGHGGPGVTLGSPWPPLAICLCIQDIYLRQISYSGII
jgi:hypothetical protein